MNDIQALLDQLHDIQGIDSIGLWPLTTSWWIVIALSLLIVLIIGYFIFRRLVFIRSWKYDTLKKLSILEQNLIDSPKETLRETLILFSDYLRRIAMRRYARKECAGLIGEDWLQWLSNHDQKNFDWKQKGKILLKAPYAPHNQNFEVEDIKDLIKAAKEWVR